MIENTCQDGLWRGKWSECVCVWLKCIQLYRVLLQYIPYTAEKNIWHEIHTYTQTLIDTLRFGGVSLGA